MLAKNAMWEKGVVQARVTNKNDKVVVINAPRGLVAGQEDHFKVVIDNAHTELVEEGDFYSEVVRDYTSIRKLETVYLYADGLVNCKTKEGKAGTAMNPASANIVSYLAKNCEIDKNRMRALLTAWIVSIYAESELELDASAITITGKRVDEFVSRMGRDKVSNKLSETRKMVTGNRETVWKSRTAFMRELCRWTMSITQMKYSVVPRLEIAGN